MSDVAVIGAGAWGSALALQCARAGNRVRLWVRDPERAAAIARTRENPRLPGFPLPEEIVVTARMPAQAELFVLAVPMQYLRAVAAMVPRGPALVCAKGLEAETLALPLEVMAALDPRRPLAVLTGPNFAHEIAAGLPAASVVAGYDRALRTEIAARLGTARFRLYGNDDPVGAQLGGAAKNVIAIAAGAVIGAGLGENARAALMTRGLAEIARLTVALGGRAETVAGLSGLGDLLLTSTGLASRNYSLGYALGRGERLEEILAARTTVTEGVTTAPALVARAAKAGLELPIAAAVADLLAGRISLQQAMISLLSRPLREE